MTSPSISIDTLKLNAHRQKISLLIWLVLVCVIMFSVLVRVGAAIWQNAPTALAKIVSPQQEVILTQAATQSAQKIDFVRDGQHIDSMCSYGSYLDPNWIADCLHKWKLAARVLQTGNSDFTQANLRFLPVGDRVRLETLLSLPGYLGSS
jgi:nitric oxide reductase large subunit